MNLKAALKLAVVTLRNQERTYENMKAAEILYNLSESSYVNCWTTKRIIKALKRWEQEHGKPPTIKDLKSEGMPRKGIIKHYVGVEAEVLLDKLFTKEPRLTKVTRFSTKEEWINCFREQFEKHCREKSFNSQTYDVLKDYGTPRWKNIAKYCGVSRWKDLMMLANVEYPEERNLIEMKVYEHVPLIERQIAAINKYTKMQEWFIKELEKHPVSMD